MGRGIADTKVKTGGRSEKNGLHGSAELVFPRFATCSVSVKIGASAIGHRRPGDRLSVLTCRNMALTYFILENGARVGPFTLEQMARLPLSPQTLVAREGMEAFLPATAYPELWPVLGARARAGEMSAMAEPQHVTVIRATLARRAVVCPVIIAINLLVFVAMVASGVNPIMPDAPTMLRWGADLWPATTSGQWWRLLTAAFLHFGAIHLLANMYALWSVGRFAEKVFGSVAFAALYLLSALISSLVSIWWDRQAITAGASGAVFAVFGAVMAFMLVRRGSFPPAAVKGIIQSTGIVIAFNVIWGLTQKGISNSAHLGGLACGLALGAIFAVPLEPGRRREQYWKRLVGGLALGVAALAIGVAVIPKAPAGSFDVRRELAFDRAREELARDERQAGETLRRLHERLEKGQIDEAEFVRLLKSEVVPVWDRMTGRLEAVEVPRGSASRGEWELLHTFVRSRRDAYRMLGVTNELGDDEEIERLIREGERAAEGLRGVVGGRSVPHK